MRQIAYYWIVFQSRLVHEKEPFIVVHPHVSQTCGVYAVRIFVVGEGVRVEVAENMSNSRTRYLKTWNLNLITNGGVETYSFQPSSALPNAEGHLQILATPTVHLFIIAANVPEELPVDGEQATGHRWRLDWRQFLTILGVLHVDPREMTRP